MPNKKIIACLHEILKGSKNNRDCHFAYGGGTIITNIL